MKEKKIAREERNQEKLANGDWVMAEFYATWCPHCQRMKPVVEEFKKLTTAYSEAATWLSDLMFNDFSSPEMITDCRTLHDKYYYDIREERICNGT